MITSIRRRLGACAGKSRHMLKGKPACESQREEGSF